jgi:hypothetical protein
MKYCLDCGLEIIGRIDKMYCSDYCRSHYHNLINKNRKSAVRDINLLLKRNAEILEKLNAYGIPRIPTAALQTAGFDFNYYTHQVITADGNTYNCCYNYGYHIISKEEILLAPVSSLVSAFKAE